MNRWLLLWFAVVGVWPFANPEHSFSTALGAVDLAVHFVAATILVARCLTRLEGRLDEWERP